MVVVVPREEDVTEGPGVFDGPEAVGEFRTVLQRPKLAFRVRVVVRHVRATVGLGDAEVRQQEGHGFRSHDAPPVGVERELAGRNHVFGDRLGDEGLRQFGAFAMRDHPPHDVPAEDVQDHVEIEVRPLGRPEQLGDVPAPQLVRRGGQQLGLLVRRMDQLIAPLARFPRLGEHPVHRPGGAQVGALVQQRGLHRGRGAVAKALRVQDRQDRRTLVGVRGRGRAAAAQAPSAPRPGAAAAAGDRRPPGRSPARRRRP